jgi:integral membrane protein (TIGR00529 family)
MPGGALFSAPMVASVDADDRLDPVLKTAVNYWFRHLWEYWWPLYPGVVLAIKYSGLPLTGFYGSLMPLSLAAMLGGYLFILRRIPNHARTPARSSGRLHHLAAALVPIGILVTVSVAGSFALPAAGVGKTLANLIAMVAGLVCAIVAVFRGSTGQVGASFRIFKSRQTWMLASLIIGVQTFSSVISGPVDGAGTTLVGQMRQELLGAGIPIILVMVIIPFVSGFVTGIAMGFVGASFPIVFALLGPSPGLHILMAATVLAYGFGYMGMMLSPIHSCFVVTAHYFKSNLYKSYRYLWGPELVVICCVMLLSGTYYLLR